jgi:hypothetical protein
LNPLALDTSLSKVVLSYPFSVLISKVPFTIVILFFAVKASLKHSILKVPLLINIFPRLSVSVSSGLDFMASPFLLTIVYVPRLNSIYPSAAIAALFAVILYSPLEFSKTSEASAPPFIIFLQSPYNVNKP